MIPASLQGKASVPAMVPLSQPLRDVHFSSLDTVSSTKNSKNNYSVFDNEQLVTHRQLPTHTIESDGGEQEAKRRWQLYQLQHAPLSHLQKKGVLYYQSHHQSSPIVSLHIEV